MKKNNNNDNINKSSNDVFISIVAASFCYVADLCYGVVGVASAVGGWGLGGGSTAASNPFPQRCPLPCLIHDNEKGVRFRTPLGYPFGLGVGSLEFLLFPVQGGARPGGSKMGERQVLMW